MSLEEKHKPLFDCFTALLVEDEVGTSLDLIGCHLVRFILSGFQNALAFHWAMMYARVPITYWAEHDLTVLLEKNHLKVSDYCKS